MCMWQSQALAGAFSSGLSVPDEYGTCSSARATPFRTRPVPAAAIAATARNAGRRPIILGVIIQAHPLARPYARAEPSAFGTEPKKLLPSRPRSQPDAASAFRAPREPGFSQWSTHPRRSLRLREIVLSLKHSARPGGRREARGRRQHVLGLLPDGAAPRTARRQPGLGAQRPQRQPAGRAGARSLGTGEPRYLGVPYGSRALILLYLQTEAIRRGTRDVELGRSMRGWLQRMGIAVGVKPYKEVREQAARISACRPTFRWHAEDGRSQPRDHDHIIKGGFAFHELGGEDDRQGSLWS